eukprot:CAMPEP_0113623756 /NCGR_PEP_ID=MMETSP0017_2-20120614/12227_1 /TAXON_ID=2856 /ORGANISM="Cylindrotheca closterium" /LENGTH=325 /DNA_ID=CAMNT_0000533727 /DNA_START=374 /DNA_END=1348 /DNA_ORIENTATION=- /assembly_acc=CAM_ASM_000147
MPSLTTVTNYSCPSTLANETVPSTVDFVGTTEEMGPTVPSFFSPSMDFIQSIDIDSIKSFAGDLKASFSFFATDLVEAFAEAFAPIMDFIQSIAYSIQAFAEDFKKSCLDLATKQFDATCALFNEKYEALSHNLSDIISSVDSIQAFAEDFKKSCLDLATKQFDVTCALFNEKYEALSHNLSDVISSARKLFDEKYDLLSDPFGVLAAGSISSAPAVTGNLTGTAINLGTIEDQQIIRKTGGGFTMSAVSLDFIIEESVLDWKPTLDDEFTKPIKAFADNLVAKTLDVIQYLDYKCIKPIVAFADDAMQAVPLQPVLTLLAILFA